MNSRSRAVLLALGLIFSLAANAQTACDSVLAKNYSSFKSSYSAMSSWLKMMTESTFNKLKTDVGVGVFDDWLKFDWSQFQEKRRQYLSSDQGMQSVDAAREEVKLYLLPDQVNAWLKCMEGEQKLAFVFEPSTISDTGATMRVHWNNADIGPLINVKMIIEGGRSSSSRFPDRFIGDQPIIPLRQNSCRLHFPADDPQRSDEKKCNE